MPSLRADPGDRAKEFRCDARPGSNVPGTRARVESPAQTTRDSFRVTSRRLPTAGRSAPTPPKTLQTSAPAPDHYSSTLSWSPPLRFLKQWTIRVDAANRRQFSHHVIDDTLDHHVVFEGGDFPTIGIALHRQFNRTIAERRFHVRSVALGSDSH